MSTGDEFALEGETRKEPDTKKYVWREYEVRCVREDALMETPILDRADLVAEYVRKSGILDKYDGREVFLTLALNRKGRLLGVNLASVGTASSTLVGMREVFRFAVMQNASSVICVHNHPSGDPSPSSQDIRITRMLREAGTCLDLSVLDHIIIGEKRFDPAGVGEYSFRAAGML